jgi:2-iminobutanoate/2-iminopropanoate deaminase
MLVRHNPSTIAAPLGLYANGVSADETGRWLHIAGQIGVMPDGRLAEGLEAQANAAWANLLAVLADAGMGVEDLVKVNHFLIRPDDVPAYGAVRNRYLGDVRPASTLIVVGALARSEWLVEVDGVAWKAS